MCSAGWDCLTLTRVHLEAAYEWLAPRHDEASAALLILLVAGVLLTGLELRFPARPAHPLVGAPTRGRTDY